MKTILITAISCIITFWITTFLNIIVSKCKEKNKKKSSHLSEDVLQHDALICLLRSNITSKYYVYNSVGSVPIYEKENVNYMYQQYKKMGGNSYIEELVIKFNKIPVKEN